MLSHLLLWQSSEYLCRLTSWLKWCCSSWRAKASAWRRASSNPPRPPPPRWSGARRAEPGGGGALPWLSHGGPVIGSRVRELGLVRGGCWGCWWDLLRERRGPLPGEGADRLLRDLPGGFARTPARPGRCVFRPGRCRRGCRSRSPCRPGDEANERQRSVRWGVFCSRCFNFHFHSADQKKKFSHSLCYYVMSLFMFTFI